MLLKHFFTPKIAHSSYLLAAGESCAIVDPQRDVDLYLQEARTQGLRITHILETHLHADFVSGHLDLAERTGAMIYAPASANCAFAHTPVAEGDVIRLGHLCLEVLETPGHTPEHISYVVTDTTRSQDPVGVFCGDTLFVGDVGRPDLFPGRAEELALALYESLHVKLLTLPDHVEVYPAHGAGSLCGRSMAAKWTSTIGYERRANQALQISDPQAFVRSLTTDMPPAPDHFARCSEINRRGPELTRRLPTLELLRPDAFACRLAEDGCLALDVRGYDAFCAQHVPGAWHIGLAGNLPTFAGWVLPPEATVLLVADSLAQAEEARIWLHRVGLDRVTGYLDGGMSAWASQGLPMAHVTLLSVKELRERLTGDGRITLVDVRAPAEFEERHIQGAVNIPGPDLRTRHVELDPGHPIYLVCSTGNRSSMAASILERHGFRRLYNVAGGMTGYSAAGYSERCSVCVNPHGPKTQVIYDPISVTDHF